MKKLLVSDLDNTLVYSKNRKLIGEKRCVEVYKGDVNSFMTEKTISLMKEITKTIEFIPLTTRSKDGFLRIDFSCFKVPKKALVCNGGMLLIDGKIDEKWYEYSLNLINPVDYILNDAISILKKDPNLTLDIRKVENLFVFTKSSNITYTLENLSKNIDIKKVDINIHKDKIYVLPKILNKGTAIDRLRNDNFKIISAGDSNFDIPMLEKADESYYPVQLKEYLSNVKHAKCIEYGNFSDEFLLEILNKNRKE